MAHDTRTLTSLYRLHGRLSYNIST